MIELMFARFCPPILQLLCFYPKRRVAAEDKNIIKGFLNIFDCHLKIFNDSWAKGKSEQEMKPVLEGIFFYSCIWSMGGICDRFLGSLFNRLLYQLIEGKISDEFKKEFNISDDIPQIRAPYSLPVPKTGDVFAYKLSINNKAEWSKWEESLDPSASLPRDIYAGNMIIPTLETIRYQHIMDLLLLNNKPFLLSGPSGTGKTLYVRDLINNKLDKEKFACSSLFFTRITKPVTTQDVIMSKLDKRRKGVYGPPLGKKFVIFVDDINLPKKDEVGSQVFFFIQFEYCYKFTNNMYTG